MEDVPASCPAVAYEDVPFSSFHMFVAVASIGGVFSDGFGLGVIGLVSGLIAQRLVLGPAALGLLAAAALAGLFVGALGTGPLIDRGGRRPVYAFNMVLLSVLSALQYLADSFATLVALRFLIGVLLGSDYVVSKAVLIEFTPRAARGRILSGLSIAWAGGYSCAYFTGLLALGTDPEAWRTMLLLSAVPCVIAALLRARIPESPLWLQCQGRAGEAVAFVKRFGAHVTLPGTPSARDAPGNTWRLLLGPALRRRTVVACALFTCQVIPYFAVGSFVRQVMSALQVSNDMMAGALYNAALLAGAVGGSLLVDHLNRRTFLFASFGVTAAALLALGATTQLPASAVVSLLAVFALGVSAASNLVYVYLPELFPTSVRGSGIGAAVASSRIGSALGTFLLPTVVATWGIHSALLACVITLLAGIAICAAWAPETRHVRLAASGASP